MNVEVFCFDAVAPVRERGLKYKVLDAGAQEVNGRSREGAWIEITPLIVTKPSLKSRSREGAWIEMCINIFLRPVVDVAPVRERGLKFITGNIINQRSKSLP